MPFLLRPCPFNLCTDHTHLQVPTNGNTHLSAAPREDSVVPTSFALSFSMDSYLDSRQGSTKAKEDKSHPPSHLPPISQPLKYQSYKPTETAHIQPSALSLGNDGNPLETYPALQEISKLRSRDQTSTCIAEAEGIAPLLSSELPTCTVSLDQTLVLT